jgi:hypothetical protein
MRLIENLREAGEALILTDGVTSKPAGQMR